MSTAVKATLLLAVMMFVSEAQMHNLGNRCLCQGVRRLSNQRQIKEIQIYRETVFCDKVEIVVTLNSGYRYCLDPKLPSARKMLTKVLRKKATPSTATQSYPTSTPANSA